MPQSRSADAHCTVTVMKRSVLQVYPLPDYSVYLYFNDGIIKKYDASELVQKGVFAPLQDKNLFVKTCTVLNHTLAWDVSGRRDPYDCLDLDAEHLYETCPSVKDPLGKIA